MSDTVTIHNGRCSYHGPADKAPVWANRSAGDGFPSSAQKEKAGAHTAHVGTTGKKQVLKTCADAPGLVRTHDQPMVEGAPSQVGKSLPKVSDVPAPLTRFEDTTHAWEEGYRAGRAEGCGQKIQQKLQRFAECADDGEDVDIGREWLDVLSTLGFLVRSQRSPARWVMTEIGERTLSAGPMGKEIW